MILIKVDDMFNVSPMSYIVTPDIFSLGPTLLGPYKVQYNDTGRSNHNE